MSPPQQYHLPQHQHQHHHQHQHQHHHPLAEWAVPPAGADTNAVVAEVGHPGTGSGAFAKNGVGEEHEVAVGGMMMDDGTVVEFGSPVLGGVTGRTRPRGSSFPEMGSAWSMTSD